MKIKVYLTIGLSRCEINDVIEIDDEELEGKNGEECDEIFNKYTYDWTGNYVDWGWKKV